MENVLVRTISSVGESNLHLQITPAYRRNIFANEQVWQLTLIFLKEKLAKLGIILLAAECWPDHAHIFLANWKNYPIPYLVQQVKGFTSYMMRKHYKHLFSQKLWGAKFWTEGYF